MTQVPHVYCVTMAWAGEASELLPRTVWEILSFVVMVGPTLCCGTLIHDMSTPMVTGTHGQRSSVQAHRVAAIKAQIALIRNRTTQVAIEIERAQTERDQLRGRHWLRPRPNWMR